MKQYLPFTQQPYCCVPAAIQMVMHRNAIPLIAQEEIAYELGLTVPEKDAYLFDKARTGSKPSSGWGTQIQDEKYEPNKIFKKLGVPLSFKQYFIRDLRDEKGLRKILMLIQESDDDALLCFDYGKLWDLETKGGHVCVFSSIERNDIYLVDPERTVPKHRVVSAVKMFRAMDFHGDSNSAGVWVLSKTS
jgi:hypothetical protein